MRHRLILLVSALGLALGGATLPLTAAHAATGTITTVDTTVDGQVSGTFTADSPRAKVEVLWPDGRMYNRKTFAPTPGTEVAFRMYTLGMEAGLQATLKLTLCDAEWANCSVGHERVVTLNEGGPVTFSAALTDSSPIVAADHPQSSIRVSLGNTTNRVGQVRMFVTWLDPSGWPIAEYPSTTTGELPQPPGTYEAVFHPEHMTSGTHRLRLTVRGSLHHAIQTQDFDVEVVNPAPVIKSFTQSATSTYPTRDGYRDTVRFTMKPAVFDPADEVRLQIEDGVAGDVVRTLTPVSATAAGGYVFEWDGHHDEGWPMWEGPFHARVTLRDTVTWAPEVTRQLSVNVVRQHLEPRVWSTTVTSAAALSSATVGGCSTLRKPARSGWSGSLGLYSNTRCRSTSGASVVRTFHDLVLPNVPVHDFIRVDTYGGSPRAVSTDAVTIRYRSGSTWGYARTHGASIGWRNGVRVPASTVLGSGRTLTWDAHVHSGRRWDLGRFRVVVGYRALVND